MSEEEAALLALGGSIHWEPDNGVWRGKSGGDIGPRYSIQFMESLGVWGVKYQALSHKEPSFCNNLPSLEAAKAACELHLSTGRWA